LGANVVVNDYGGSRDGVGASSAPAEQVVEAILEAGGQAVAHGGNVSDPDEAGSMVELALRSFGGLHCLVNNAGILRDKTLLKMTMDDWNAVVDVHLKGTFVMTQAAGRYWRRCAKEGDPVAARIVNTTSGSGLFGNFGQANYSSAKGGIASLTILSAIELGQYGVTANAVAPVAKTRLISGDGIVPELKEGFDPFDPANVSSLVCWLASENSGEVSGQIFSAAGGFISVVEGYNRGPEMLHDRRLTFDDIDSELPELVRKARVRTTAIESHPYTKFG
jgi:NAD(P)-dependent dehydrogenase (short-subunit alcohol dehydrogenase family)